MNKRKMLFNVFNNPSVHNEIQNIYWNVALFSNCFQCFHKKFNFCIITNNNGVKLDGQNNFPNSIISIIYFV